jgi:hypothetical protein
MHLDLLNPLFYGNGDEVDLPAAGPLRQNLDASFGLIYGIGLRPGVEMQQ